MKTIKAHITCWLIRLAMITCAWGATYEALDKALGLETWYKDA